MTKAVEDRILIFGWLELAAAVVGGVGLVFTGFPSRVAIEFAIASAALHVVYNFALMNAYRLGAFNQMYPVARGTSPLVVALGAAVFAHEHLGGLALAGVAILAVGLMSLAFSSGLPGRRDVPALGAAVATGLAIAAYTLVDGLGVRHTADPFAYTALLFLMQGPVFIGLAVVRRPVREWTAGGIAWRGLLAGCLSVAAYGAVIWAQTKAPLAEVAALRETGVISAAVIGALFFKEGFGFRRIIAAGVVALGIVLISI